MYIRYILGGPIERKMPARGPVPHRTDMASHHLLSTPIPSPSAQAVAGSLCWEKIWSTAARDTKAAATGSTQLLPPTPEAPHSSIPLSESGAAYSSGGGSKIMWLIPDLLLAPEPLPNGHARSQMIRSPQPFLVSRKHAWNAASWEKAKFSPASVTFQLNDRLETDKSGDWINPSQSFPSERPHSKRNQQPDEDPSKCRAEEGK